MCTEGHSRVGLHLLSSQLSLNVSHCLVWNHFQQDNGYLLVNLDWAKIKEVKKVLERSIHLQTLAWAAEETTMPVE